MWPRVALRCGPCGVRLTATSTLPTTAGARRCASTTASPGTGPVTSSAAASSPRGSPPSSSNNASSEPLRRSLFRRSGSPTLHGTSTGPSANLSQGNGGAAAVVDVDAVRQRIALPLEMRTPSLLLSYLQRLQGTIRLHRLPVVEAHARCEVQKLLLPAVQGMDASAVVALLQALRLVDADPTTPVLHDAVAWLSLYMANLPLSQFVKTIELLQYFHPALADEFVSGMSRHLQVRDVASLTIPQAVVLLTAVVPRLTNVAGEAEEHADGEQGERSSTATAGVDAKLVRLAGALRDRCKSAECVAVPVDDMAQLLVMLLSFKSSGGHPSGARRTSWESLTETAAALLAAPSHTATISLAAAGHLLEALTEAARRRAVRNRVDRHVGSTADAAEERLAAALVKRLQQAAAVLQEAGGTSQSKTTAAAELPAPWKPRDVRQVWDVVLRYARRDSSHAAATTEGKRDDGTPPAHSAACQLMSELRDVLLTYVSTLFATHSTDEGMAEMAVHMALDLVKAERAAAQNARDLFPEARASTNKATTAAAAEEVAAAAAAAAFTDLSSVLPPALLETLLLCCASQLASSAISWTPAAVADTVTLLSLSSDAGHRTQSLQLARAWYKHLQAAAQAGDRVTPRALLAFFTPELLRKERVGVDTAVQALLRRWSVSEVLYFLAHITTEEATDGGLEAASVLRTAGSALSAYAARASAGQLAALTECFGAARVRSDEFCDAAIARLTELLGITVLGNARLGSDFSTLGAKQGAAEPGVSGSADSVARNVSPMSITHLTQLLRTFALLEVRKTQPFLDAAPHVILAANEDRGTAEEVTQLLAAYAKMLMWNYPVYRALAERLARMRRDQVTLNQLVTAQLALLRVDVTLPEITARFYQGLTALYGSETLSAEPLPAEWVDRPLREGLQDTVMHLSILSRLYNRSPVSPPEPRVAAGITRRLLQHAEILSCADIAEVLLSLARLGEGTSPAFDQLTLHALGLLPTSPPRVMAHLVEAYAVAGRGDKAELFTLVAERTVAMQHDMAAITIGSILSSFAKAGVRNDRLFIEMIPRARHVGTYGTPRDIVNVVSAYAAVNLWHYKLFAKLAERAVQLRADFRVTELVPLLSAYAKVQMRYDTLFTEFAPRIQTLSHLLTPADLVAIVSSYNQLDIPCPPVWKATAERAVVVAAEFTEAEAEKLLSAYSTQTYYNADCVAALTEIFPALSSIPFEKAESNSAEGEEDVGEKAAAAE